MTNLEQEKLECALAIMAISSHFPNSGDAIRRYVTDLEILLEHEKGMTEFLQGRLTGLTKNKAGDFLNCESAPYGEASELGDVTAMRSETLTQRRARMKAQVARVFDGGD